MAKNYKTEKIGVTALCRVSAKGGEGIYLYIPKNYADAYHIVGADLAEVTFKRLFFKASDEEPKLVDSSVKDWSQRTKTEKKKAGGAESDDGSETVESAGFVEGEL